jgi:hypothetical protein
MSRFAEKDLLRSQAVMRSVGITLCMSNSGARDGGAAAQRIGKLL